VPVCAHTACLIAGSSEVCVCTPIPLVRAHPPACLCVRTHGVPARQQPLRSVCACPPPSLTGLLLHAVFKPLHGGLENLFKSLPSKIAGTGVCFVWWYEKFFVSACAIGGGMKQAGEMPGFVRVRYVAIRTYRKCEYCHMSDMLSIARKSAYCHISDT
jgi:hypothetical protein